ncbi:hypothetical protein [Thiobacillus sedimenti]|uniref:Uncharacterized protein n=1 Tax=Thiobacillus sedimenti TaxID=3110231 RepID=A0ABZ1CM33_9PROT|nr:hypothetical protein [Thiobacillus sp. SCUT-2]WRS40456.1 hypothetical protein VA613_06160 [Thiobacillus sp. SCUT-2]
MPSLIKRTFLITLALPVLCAIWILFAYDLFLGRVSIIRLSFYLSSQLPGLLYLTGILAVPGALLYFAAHLSQRAWFAVGCCVVCILFAAALCTLLLVKGGGMGIPAIAAAEAVVAAMALLVASLLRLHQLTRHSSGTR